MSSASEIDRETAANILNYFYADEGYSGGSFCEALLRAATKADHQNLARLAAAFPEKISAYRLAHDTDGGIDILRAIVYPQRTTA